MSKYSRNYSTTELKPCLLPSLGFYRRMAGILLRAGRLANQRPYTAEDWIHNSEETGMALEAVGCQIHVEGMENVEKLDTPCVFVANHMSTLETFMLPGIIQPVRDVTFVVKASLLKYPCLGPVLKSRDPLVVTRTNPREDLSIVLNGGCEHLANGRSVIIFPQGTRSHTVDPHGFSSLGVKLARKAKVPMIPIALKTDAWGSGRLIKDVGFIRPNLPIHFRFGEPIYIEGNGKAEQELSVNYIKEWFDIWTREATNLAIPKND